MKTHQTVTHGTRREWVVALALVVALLGAACGGDDADVATADPTATVEAGPTSTAEPAPTATAEPEPTPTVEPEPTPTAEPEPTATPEPFTGVDDGALSLRGDGFGPWDWGVDAEVVLAALATTAETVDDTGWVDRSDVCAESGTGPFRQLTVGDLTLSFTDIDGLVEWYLDGEIPALRTPDNVGPGVTVADVDANYGDRLDGDGVSNELGGSVYDVGLFTVEGMVGVASSVEPGGVVETMWAGFGCQRLF